MGTFQPVRPVPAGKPTPARPAAAGKPNLLLEAGSVLLLLINMFMSMAAGTKEAASGAEVIGAAFAPPVIALLVWGAFRLFGRGRSRTSASKIVFWTMVVVLVGNIGNLAN